MTIGGLLTRWNTARKLRKGQCLVCRHPLRDDAKDEFCSDECAFEQNVHNAL